MANEKDIALRRILVALDVSEQSRAALESAARLAAGLQAELVGLFVEDSELLQIAELPVSRLVGPGGIAALDAALLRRAFKVQAAEARRALEATAERWQVKSSFQVTRGAAAEVVVAEASHFDLVALGRTSRPGGRRAPLGATARHAARTASCSVLVSRSGKRAGCPVMVVFEGDERPLGLAAALSGIYSCRLLIQILESDDAAAGKLAARAKAWLEERGLPGQISRLESSDAMALRQAVLQADCGLLLLDRQGPQVSQLDLDLLLEDQDTPVLLLR